MGTSTRQQISSVSPPQESKPATNADMVGLWEETLLALKELYALVKGECPSLLDEDTGGAIRTDMWIEKIISAHAKYRPVKANDSGELSEALKLIELARQHGGPVAYSHDEDSVGYYVCCGNASYEDHDDDCWYRKICEFADRHASSREAK